MLHKLMGDGAAADGQVQPLSTAEALHLEFERLWGEKLPPISEPLTAEKHRKALQDYYEAAFRKDQAALCLSGGGVRSAAFALGVIEALAKKGLLTQFHYLSTVSGGGYIGGMLSRWIAERGDAVSVEAELARAATPGMPEPPPTQWLREYSNFLTPRTGIASADTWSAAILWIRNTLINWFVFLPAFLIAVAVPNLYLSLLFGVTPGIGYILTIVSIVLIVRATYCTCAALPSHALPNEVNTKEVLRNVVAPALIASFLLPLALAPFLLVEGTVAAHAATLGAAVMAGGLILGYVLAWKNRRGSAFKPNFPTWIIGALISGGAVGIGAYLLTFIDCSRDVPYSSRFECGWRGSVYASFAPLWVSVAQLLLTILYTAFRIVPVEPPTLSPDLDREWLARLSAVKLRFSVVFSGFAAVALLGPVMLIKSSPLWNSLVGLLTAGSGLTAVLGGKAAPTGDTVGSPLRKHLTFSRIVLIATVIFIALLTILLARLETFLVVTAVERLGLEPRSAFVVLTHLIVILLAGALLWLTSTKINVNRFSLNAVYRNRLGRAFLGAARRRNPDPFTNFDPADNVRMAKLAPAPPDGGRAARPVLYPVVNMALNLVGGDRLAWQERKAHSFTVTPLASGSAALRSEGEGEALGGYVPTALYAGKERDVHLPGSGITLATCMAISGAAASPNMGYNSSPATAFLMTLFNVRLGAWLPNPGYPKFAPDEMMRSAPTNALRPFLNELAGQTHDRAKDIYLSDGGHFENLGIYEMIRRRCRYIIVSDAGCDPDCKFEDLGNAVRKIMADLDGVTITFKELKIKSRKSEGDSPITYAFGMIDYGKNAAGDPQTGEILYIKPTYFAGRPQYFKGDLPVDVRAYANLHEDFPHESTADQWFSESQFESYRRLGETFVFELGVNEYSKAGLVGFFGDLRPKASDPAPISPAA